MSRFYYEGNKVLDEAGWDLRFKVVRWWLIGIGLSIFVLDIYFWSWYVVWVHVILWLLVFLVIFFWAITWTD